jgi:glutamine synthetase
MNNSGKLSIKELIEKVNKKEIKYVTVYFSSYHCANAKRYEANYFINYVLPGKAKCIDCLFGCNFENGRCENNTVLWSSGYSDNNFLIDEDSVRRQAWLGSDYALCMSKYLNNALNELHPFSPRNILIKVLESPFIKSYRCMSASELEFYVFSTPNREITKENPQFNLTNHMLTQRSEYCMGFKMDETESLTRMFKDTVKDCGIELEGLFNEEGPGQFEINIKYCDTLEMCDNHVILKDCIKNVCFKSNRGCTFMAKPFSDKGGSSFHCHMSFYDKLTGGNIFTAREGDSHIIKEHGLKCSNNLLYFIGGVLKYLPELYVIYAPYVNSYKRYKKNSFAPFFINTWSVDNRFSTIRVIGKDDNIHIEMRLAGADANPYLVNAVIIACGFDGIKNKIHPPEISTGNIYQANGRIPAPHNLYSAVKLFERSEFAKKLFGVDYHEYLCKFSKYEWDSYETHISNYEINRYIDIV